MSSYKDVSLEGGRDQISQLYSDCLRGARNYLACKWTDSLPGFDLPLTVSPCMKMVCPRNKQMLKKEINQVVAYGSQLHAKKLISKRKKFDMSPQ